MIPTGMAITSRIKLASPDPRFSIIIFSPVSKMFLGMEIRLETFLISVIHK